jgi:hypothetical protein
VGAGYESGSVVEFMGWQVCVLVCLQEEEEEGYEGLGVACLSLQRVCLQLWRTGGMRGRLKSPSEKVLWVKEPRVLRGLWIGAVMG